MRSTDLRDALAVPGTARGTAPFDGMLLPEPFDGSFQDGMPARVRAVIVSDCVSDTVWFVVTAARLAREAGATVILNAAPARLLGGLAGLIDILVVNAVEAEMLGSWRADDLESAAAASRELRRLAPAVIVTAGAAGVAVASADETMTVPAHQVQRAETHGAGDVFVGALAARLAAAAPLSDALRYANAAAALHVGTPEVDRDALGPTDVRRLLSVGAGG